MRTSLRTTLLSAVASLGLVAAAAAGASAGAPGQPVIQLQPNPVVAGETVTVNVTGWECGSLIQVEVFDDDDFELRLDEGAVVDGAAQFTFPAPDVPGLYFAAVFEDEGSSCDDMLPFNVTAPVDTTVETTVPIDTTVPEEPTTTVEAILPPTGGGQSTPWVAMAALALLAGGAVIVVRANATRRGSEPT